MNHSNASPRPWYRESAPWLLMAGPAAVVIAAAITLWLAMRAPDGLVSEDYYKRGLLVERRVERDVAAQKLGLRARLVFDDEAGRMRVEFANPTLKGDLPVVVLTHSARPQLDRRLELQRVSARVFEVPLAALTHGRWGIVIETPTWRLEADWQWPRDKQVDFGAQP